MNPGVFISHKLNDHPTDGFLAALRPDLEALGCKVWLDTDIAAGEIWRHELSTWMSACTCAVILVTKAALTSEWIFQEASILSWRAEQDPDFKLFPVVLDGLTDADIAASRLKVVLGIDRLQWPARNGTDAEKLVATTETVRLLLAARKTANDEYSKTAREIAEILKNTSDEALANSIEFLKIQTKGWVPGGNAKLVFALKLLSVTPLEMRDALDRLDVKPLIKGQIGKLALPFWVDGEAARAVCRHALVTGDRPLLLLNAAYHETAGDYVVRGAFSPNRSWFCHPFSHVFGEDLPGELWDEVCACIALAMGEDPTAMEHGELRDLIDATLAIQGDSRQFVAIDIRNSRKPADWAEFEILRKDHGSVVYLLLSGREIPAAAEWQGAAVEPLRPEILPDLEKAIRGLRGKFKLDCNQSR